MLHRATALAVGGFPAERHAEDLELWVRIIKVGRATALGRVTGVCGEHEDQLSKDVESMRARIMEVVHKFDQEPWVDAALRRRLRVRFDWEDIRQAQRDQARLLALHSLWLLMRDPRRSILLASHVAFRVTGKRRRKYLDES